jgi:hypothetical protein
MAKQLTAQDAKLSLTAHVTSKGEEILAKYGPGLGWSQLQELLQDRAYVRYPCEIKFDASQLLPGEFAHPVPNSERPEDGFVMYVHPVYMTDLAQIPLLVLYQLIAVNYGEFASHEDAEAFAAASLGLSRDDYYQALCELADRLGAGIDPGQTEVPGGCSGSCSCGGHD